MITIGRLAPTKIKTKIIVSDVYSVINVVSKWKFSQQMFVSLKLLNA